MMAGVPVCRVGFLIFALVGGASVGSPVRADTPIVNIGHRGASAYAPEHTFASYDLALRLGADYIEQDLQLTSDGVLVVLHDSTLDRTARGDAANCTGPVSGRTLSQIKTCDVGIWFNEANPAMARPEYVGLRIPALDEVFERYGRRVNYYIETKSPEASDHMEERLLALLERHRLLKPAARRWRVVIQSFSAASLQKLHTLEPSLPLILLGVAFGTDAQLEQSLDAVAPYAVGIGPAVELMDVSVVGQAHARCLVVHPWTVDEPSDMSSLVDLGVDGMFTNAPDALDEVLGRRALRAGKAARRAAKRHATCLRAAS